MHTFFYYFSFLYYVLLLWNLMLELNYLLYPGKIIRIKTILTTYPKGNKRKIFTGYLLTHGVAMINVFIGIFTSQWLILLTYFLFGLFMGGVVYNKLNLRIKSLVCFDGLVCSSLILFAIINKVHLHYSMQDILTFLF